MFLAYNNGISATADNIELDETGHYVKRISNLQIVMVGKQPPQFIILGIKTKLTFQIFSYK